MICSDNVRPFACVLLLIADLTRTKGSPYLETYPRLTKVPSTNESSVPLYFGLMLSLSGDQQSTGALAGVQAALDEINSRDDLLPGYSLHYTLTDSKVLLLLGVYHPACVLIQCRVYCTIDVWWFRTTHIV